MTVTRYRYVPPQGADRVVNAAVRWLTDRGVSVLGTRVLTVRGRRSGMPRRTPVNVLTIDGARYLVAPRGVTDWVRNVRASGGGELRVGRRRETVALVELPDAERIMVLRRYLRRWGWEVGRFVDGLTKDSSDADLAAAAPDFPVFRIESAGWHGRRG